MRLHIRTLRKIIREALSYDQESKLWELFASGPEGYRQAWELWDTIDPGGCPLPEDPYEWFGSNEQDPVILELFGQTSMSLEDPDYFFNEFCSAEWLEPKEDLGFEFRFSFVCGDENAEYDFGMGESFYVVPGTDRNVIIDYIKQDFTEELDYLTEGTWWGGYTSIDVDVANQADLTELENGWCVIYVKYN